jgi:hypothetical protein
LSLIFEKADFFSRFFASGSVPATDAVTAA